MNSEQTAAWEKIKKDRLNRLQQGREQTCDDAQQFFFSLPEPPRPTAWDVEWRWNKDRLLVRIGDRYPDDLLEETMEELNAFCGENPWQRHRNPRYQNINSSKYMDEALSRLRDEFPGKEFRATARRWRTVTEPTMLDDPHED